MNSHDSDSVPPGGPLDAMSPAEKRALLARLLAERREKRLLRPLSFGQRRFWFFEQMEPGTSIFHLPFTLRLAGKVSQSALEAALDRLAERHDTLRTAIVVVDGEPFQVVSNAPIRTLAVHDLRGLPDAEREREVQRLSTDAAEVPFDLAKAPLWRAELLRLRDDDHLLLFTIHHLIADGWSIGVFLRDLVTAYEAAAAGATPGWAPLAIQYGDVVEAQQRPDYEARLQKQLAFWQEQLSGQLPVLQLPTDAPRPAVQTYRAGRVSAALPEAAVRNLKDIARRSDATLFMTLLAAFKVVLWRLSGEADVIVGTPVAGRTRAEEEDLIGLFINTVGLRDLLGPDLSFAQLLEAVKQGARSAYSNADVPFDRVVQALQVPRTSSHTPVFQVLFNLLGFRAAPSRLGDATMEVRWDLDRSSKFDLTLYARDEGTHVSFDLVYNADLFRPARMQAFAAAFVRVAEQVAVNPDLRLGAVDLVDDAAREVLPDPRKPLPRRTEAESVLGRLRHWATASPDAVAIADVRERWTYAELEQRSSRIASALAGDGIGPGDLVAVYAHRGVGLLACMLGVWKAGAAFFLLDPAHPPRRLAACVEMAMPSAWIEMAGAGPLPSELDALAGGARCRLRMPTSGQAFETALPAPVDIQPRAIESGDRAYVAFTSGSTGQPRGIVGTHGPVDHFLAWYERTFAPGAGDRTSVLSGLAHDPLFRDLLVPIWSGGCAVMPDPERVLEPGWLARWISEERISLMHLTPPMAELILQDAPAGSLARLRAAFFGGEVLRTELAGRFQDAATGATLVNFYGATETPQAMAWNVIDPRRGEGERLANRETVPVGRGIDDVQILVLSEGAGLAGIGELGEICIRTPYLASGYLHDHAQTAARFVTNPFTGDPGDRLYRTGDFGRYLPDGSVEFGGRRDLQIKIRGYRVELEALEAVIREHAGVDAAIAALEAHPDGARIVAHVKWRDGAASDADLDAFVRSRLPDYMVPSAFGVLAAVPLTPNGKIDRRQLPSLSLVRERAAAWAPPEGETETALASIFEQVLSIAQVGRHDSFFSLGGHSLAVTRLVARINKQFGIVVPLRVPFDAPTVAALTRHVDAMASRRLVADTIEPHAVPRDGELPLSFAQERMWFLYQLDRANPTYSIAVTVRLHGPLDVEALRRSWRYVVERHEALRTIFPAEDGKPRVSIQAAGPELAYVSLEEMDGGQREEEALRLAQEASRLPFDLATELPCRATVWGIERDDHILQILIHHIVGDQWSSGLLARELAQAYNSYRHGEPPDLAPLTIQYVDFTAWQRQWFQGETLDRQVEYWRRQLAGLEPLELPADRPRPTIVSGRGAQVSVPLPPALARTLQRTCEQEGATLFMALLAAFKVLLYRYTGRTDIAVGSPIANRTQTFTEPLVGMFVNTLVLRTSLEGNPTFRELLARVRETALGGYAHQDLPFEKLVAELHPARDLSHAPLVQVLFNLQNAPMRPVPLDGLSGTMIPIDRGTSQFDLSVAIEPEHGRTLTAEYSTDLFDASTIRRLLDHYVRVLEVAAADPSVAIGQLPMLSDDEHRQAVFEWNATAREYDGTVGLDALLEQQAQRTPDRVAIRCGGDALTYRELQERVVRLAQALRQEGVGPEVPVAVCLERSLDLPVAMLGVLKAGGAYVPLDPAFPSERLAYMLADSGARVLVTASQAAPELDTSGVKTIDLDGWRSQPAQPAGELPSYPGGERLAYVIYTSGSTGRPKGVQIVHRALVNFLRSMTEQPGLTSSDVLLSVTTPSFDIFGLELYLPLLVGGTVVIATADDTTDGSRLVSLLEEHGVTVMQATPATWRLMLDAGWAGRAGLKVLCGGEPMPRDLANVLVERAGEVWNLYGPTETTIWSSVERVSAGAGPVSIGRPIWNTDILILDANGQPVPVGVPGDLLIGGDGLARGYFKRPELDAEKFIPHPYRQADGARLYRTGDRGRHLPDGRIECLGRGDDQVKVRGFRIELGEIESVLGQHEAVRQAVASVYDDPTSGRRLVAYVAFHEQGEATPSELRRFARQHLPEYMVPSLFAVIDEVPLTPNGKVNRRALPPPLAESRPPAERIAPRTEMERLVASIWTDVIGVKDVSIHDNFFDIGGHSLLSIQAIVRIEKRTGVRLNPARLIMDNLEQISAACETMTAALAAQAGAGGAHLAHTPESGS